MKQFKDSLYGQVFMFGCEKYNGLYGNDIAIIILKILIEHGYSGFLEYYAAHTPSWSQDWTVSIIFEKEAKYDYWDKIRNSIKEKLPNAIAFYGMEAGNRLSVRNDLMFLGTLELKNGVFMAEEDGYFNSLIEELT